MNYYLGVLTFIAINGLLGLSVYLVLSTGQLTLGNAGFMGIGAYASALLTWKAGLPMWLAIPAGALLAMAIAVPLGYASLRLRGIYLAIATLGFSQVVTVVAGNVEYFGGALGIKDHPQITTVLQQFLRAAVKFQDSRYYLQVTNLIILVGISLVLLLSYLFVARQGKSRVGRAFTAIRTDELAAAAMGINTTGYKVLAFAQGAFLAGLAGALNAHITYFVGPSEFGFSRAVEMLTFVVVGGSLIPFGAIFGAFAMMTLAEYLRDVQLFGMAMKDFRPIIYGLLMMLMMTLRPQGLLTPGLGKGVLAWLRSLRSKGSQSASAG